ncbi:MAG: molybdopterin-binding protein [Alphaproteobacteria bacterium]
MSNTPTAAMLIIGNEVLSGRTADANLNYVARRMTDVGIALRECRVVADVESEIADAVNALRAKHTYVFTTGGIGPTHDDITIASVAKAFGVPVVRNARVEEHLRKELGNKATTATFRMADYPEGAEPVWHGETWAPGCRMENVFIMAGIPRVMQVMLEAAIPLLQQGPPIHARSVDAWTRESVIAEPLGEIQARYPAVDIGSYPYRIDNRPGTTLVVRGTDLAAVEGAYAAVMGMLDGVGAELRAA